MLKLWLSKRLPFIFCLRVGIRSEPSLIKLLIRSVLHYLNYRVIYSQSKEKILLLISIFIPLRMKIRQNTCQIWSLYSVLTDGTIHLLMFLQDSGNKRLLSYRNFFFLDNLKCNIQILLVVQLVLGFGFAAFVNVPSLFFLDNAIQPHLRLLTHWVWEHYLVKFDSVLLFLLWIVDEIVIKKCVRGFLFRWACRLLCFLYFFQFVCRGLRCGGRFLLCAQKTFHNWIL